MVITLIGYRGTGKSTVAARLAARLGWNWVDADDRIEQQAGKSIRQIFADDGEPEFRRLERETMAELLIRPQDRLVLAAGGGAILNPQTCQDMQSAGPVVWLTASIESILTRLGNDDTTSERRPDLTDEGGRHEVETTLAARRPIYQRTADVMVDTDERSVDQIVEDILHELRPRLREGADG